MVKELDAVLDLHVGVDDDAQSIMLQPHVTLDLRLAGQYGLEDKEVDDFNSLAAGVKRIR